MTDDDSADDSEDPFERLGDVERDGDPFERLGDPDADAVETAETETGEGPVEDDATVGDETTLDPGTTDPYSGPDRTANGDVDRSTTTSTGGHADDPFADVETPAEDPFGAGQGAFERVDVGEIDVDDIWDAITGDGDDDEVEIPEDTRYAEVSKHSFCEQCEYFSEPPDVHCTNEAAEIIEFTDMETVRLLDCPIVAERKKLE